MTAVVRESSRQIRQKRDSIHQENVPDLSPTGASEPACPHYGHHYEETAVPAGAQLAKQPTAVRPVAQHKFRVFPRIDAALKPSDFPEITDAK
jgi:hypothetical protein